jgi:hypothetical protein
MHRRLSFALSVAVLMAGGLVACSGDSNDNSPVAQRTGGLTIGLTDAPVDDAAEVVVVFTGMELQRVNGDRVTLMLPSPRSIDLLQLSDGRTTNLVENLQVEAGEYEWMRLMITAEQNLQSGSYIKLKDGRQFPLYIPSGSETGLKLQRRFTVALGNITRLMVDFDLRKSVVAPPGQAPNWILRPSLRLFDDLQVGRITGSVDLTALAAAQGMTLAGADPVTYRGLPNDGVATTVGYTLHFVEAGAYTVAATCNYDVDASPSVSEYDPTATPPAAGQPPPPGFQTMKWSRKAANVASGQAATVNLP